MKKWQWKLPWSAIDARSIVHETRRLKCGADPVFTAYTGINGLVIVVADDGYAQFTK